MKKFFTLCASAMMAVCSMAGVIQVQWPAEAIDATGADPIELNDGIFAVGNNSKVTLTANGFYTGGNSSSSARHMYFTPTVNGTLTVEATASGDNTDRYVFLATAASGDMNTGFANAAIPEKGVRHTVEAYCAADRKVYICLQGNGTITNIKFEYEDAATTWAIESATMNWAGEQYAAGAEVPVLSYMVEVPGAAGFGKEGHVEFLDAEGKGIAVADNVAGGYIFFHTFGETGYTTPGTYTLNIPAGAIVNEAGEPCEAFTATWTVKEQAAKTPWAIEGVTMNWMGEQIAAGAEVEALSYMYEVAGAMSFGEGHVEFLDAEGNGIAVASNVAYGYLQFASFGQNGYTTPGTYTLNIPAGALLDAEGNPCEAYTATWTVKEQAAKTPWAISEVVMQWMGEEIAAGSDVWTLSGSYVIKGEKTAMSFGEGHVEFLDAAGMGVQVASEINYGYLKFPFGENGYNTPGTYTLNIPAGALVDEEGNPCEAFTATWTVKEQPTLGSCWSWYFNVDEDPFYGVPTLGDLEANGLMIRFPEQANITPEMTAKVEYTVATFGGGEVMPFAEDDANASNDDEDIDPAFGVDDEVFIATGDALFGDLTINLVDGILYIMETGAGAYEINVRKVEVFDENNVAVFTWTPNEEEGEIFGTLIEVRENEPIDDPTAIQTIAAEKSAKIFNIMGQRVNAAKGLVIKNGVKTLNK